MAVMLVGCTFGVDGSFARDDGAFVSAVDGTLDEGPGQVPLETLRTSGEERIDVRFRCRGAGVERGELAIPAGLGAFFGTGGTATVELTLDGVPQPARIERVEDFGTGPTVHIRVDRPRAPMALTLLFDVYRPETEG